MHRPTLPLLTKKILFIEEDSTIRLRVSQSLAIEGYQLYQAQNGDTALDLLNQIAPDLILLDANFIDHRDTLFFNEIRENPRWLPVPIILLIEESTDINDIRLDAAEYISKPINTMQLVNAVNKCLLRSAQIQIAHIDLAYLETVTMLANAIESRDSYTHGHVERVTRYARWLAEKLGWPDENFRSLEYGARLHDIGKIIVPDHILLKNGPLTDLEWEEMKRHPEAGASMLVNISHLRNAVPYVLHHHEWWDGSGYPMGLTGREIPIEARIMAIVDVYDALTTNRPYRDAEGSSNVKHYMKEFAGKQFDPEMFEIFLVVLDEHGL
jgi:putative two-component system response regulator